MLKTGGIHVVCSDARYRGTRAYARNGEDGDEGADCPGHCVGRVSAVVAGYSPVRRTVPRRFTKTSNIQCEIHTEVSRLVTMPTSKVTANPRMGPEPYE